MLFGSASFPHRWGSNRGQGSTLRCAEPGLGTRRPGLATEATAWTPVPAPPIQAVNQVGPETPPGPKATVTKSPAAAPTEPRATMAKWPTVLKSPAGAPTEVKATAATWPAVAPPGLRAGTRPHRRRVPASRRTRRRVRRARPGPVPRCRWRTARLPTACRPGPMPRSRRLRPPPPPPSRCSPPLHRVGPAARLGAEAPARTPLRAGHRGLGLATQVDAQGQQRAVVVEVAVGPQRRQRVA